MWDSKLSSGLHTDAMPPWAYWLELSGRRSLVTSTTRPARAHSSAQVRPAMPLPRTRKSLSTGTWEAFRACMLGSSVRVADALRLLSRIPFRKVSFDADGGVWGGSRGWILRGRPYSRRHLPLPGRRRRHALHQRTLRWQVPAGHQGASLATCAAHAGTLARLPLRQHLPNAHPDGAADLLRRSHPGDRGPEQRRVRPGEGGHQGGVGFQPECHLAQGRAW